MKTTQSDNFIKIEGSTYNLGFDAKNPFFVDLRFNNGIGAKLFVASGCDRDDGIDELIELSEPTLTERDGSTLLVFIGKTTLWDKVEYIFELQEERVVYSYRVHGKGQLELARYFEGFIQNDTRRSEAYYPYFCGPGRHLSHHRPVKELSLIHI